MTDSTTTTATTGTATPVAISTVAPEHLAAIVEGAVKGARSGLREDIANHPFSTVLIALVSGTVIGAAAGIAVVTHL